MSLLIDFISSMVLVAVFMAVFVTVGDYLILAVASLMDLIGGKK